ncbi:helix-turn-helix domain-containing protein [Streptomyces sp. NPDC001502]|uniref:helix-turn-helix domain-containing protein n=1 Tax=Streptomyces sp. NPDC001502 TaxID=3364578 RepID=UPI003680DBE5
MSSTRTHRPRAGRRTPGSALAEPVLGLPRVPKGTHLTGEDRVRFNLAVIAAYTDERQASIRQITEETGRSYGTIHRLLTDANVPLRGRGGSRERQGRAPTGPC